MKLLIIGATRGIGRNLVEQALAEGHFVKALVRDPERLPVRHDRLDLITGDIRDKEAVGHAVADQQAVCITIGVNPTRKPVSVFSEGTQNVIAAMTGGAPGFLICVTGIGAGDSKHHGGFLYDRIFNPLLLKTIYADKDRQEALVRQSKLEWVIVRPGFLTNGPLTGTYRALTELEGVKAGKISRADVAHFILTEFKSKHYLAKTPLLTY
ncbi:MAG: SDR family oxidoreductase [Desulfobacterales bacterium]